MSDNEQPQESSIVIEFHVSGSLEFDIKTQGCGPVHLLAAGEIMHSIALAPERWKDWAREDSNKIVVDFSQEKVIIIGDDVFFTQLFAAAGYLRTLGERQLNDMWTADAMRKQRDYQAQRQVESMMRQKPEFVLPTDGAH